MRRGLLFIAITGFWVTMTVLLWRAEYGTDADGGAGLPVSVVWQRILTAPDDSGLAVNLAGQKIGFIRWVPAAGEEATTGKVVSENEVEGRVASLTNYTVNADGNFLLPNNAGRLRFDLSARFGRDRGWREWNLLLIQRPNQWRIIADKDKDRLEIRVGAGKESSPLAMKLSDLRNPQKFMAESGIGAALPLAATMIPGLDPALLADLPTNAPPTSLGLNWTARQDWLKMGQSRIRIYRLEARLFEDYKAVILLSRVGEILRVELPGEITLVNESLINL